MPVLARPAAALAFALAVAPVVFTQPAVVAPAVTLDALMATPFPTDLVAAPTGGRIAWVSSASGVHNVLDRRGAGLTSGGAVTTYTGDDGLWITELGWTSDAKTSSTCEATAPTGRASRRTPRSCRTAPSRRYSRSPLTAARRRRLGAGSGPVAVTARPARGVGVARPDLERRSRRRRQGGAARERARQRLGPGVVARRIDARLHERSRHAQLHRRVHAGIARVALPRSVARSRRQPGVVARRHRASPGCVRPPRRGRGCSRRAATVDEPWSLRVADVKTGQARQVWKADAGYGSAFQGVVADSQLLLGRRRSPGVPVGEGRLAASVLGAGRRAARAALLTPGDFEVEYVSLAPDRSRIIYNSNQDDIDKRHVWTVPVDGSAKPARSPPRSAAASGSRSSPATATDRVAPRRCADAAARDGHRAPTAHAHSLLENMLPGRRSIRPRS